ncbi:MAG: BrnT family toxin [Deltaproteobacteria bacterium]|nr:BrnT family toxin [Deltaproteobacteria bacterium]
MASTALITFDWDRWNIQKNEAKHGVSAAEAESAFYDHAYRLFEDWQHSAEREKRYILYGKSMEGRVLMIGFTVRGRKVRIITARPASRKERELYGAG